MNRVIAEPITRTLDHPKADRIFPNGILNNKAPTTPIAKTNIKSSSLEYWVPNNKYKSLEKIKKNKNIPPDIKENIFR